MTLWVDADNLLEYNGLEDQDGNTVTDATVTATVFESDQTTEVGGQTWPATLNGDGNGNYSAILEDTMELVAGNRYWVDITAEGGGADDRRLKLETAKYRGFDD